MSPSAGKKTCMKWGGALSDCVQHYTHTWETWEVLGPARPCSAQWPGPQATASGRRGMWPSSFSVGALFLLISLFHIQNTPSVFSSRPTTFLSKRKMNNEFSEWIKKLKKKKKPNQNPAQIQIWCDQKCISARAPSRDEIVLCSSKNPSQQQWQRCDSWNIRSLHRQPRIITVQVTLMICLEATESTKTFFFAIFTS